MTPTKATNSDNIDSLDAVCLRENMTGFTLHAEVQVAGEGELQVVGEGSAAW